MRQFWCCAVDQKRHIRPVVVYSFAHPETGPTKENRPWKCSGWTSRCSCCFSPSASASACTKAAENAAAKTNADWLHMILPADHKLLPWTGVVAGMWIPIVYYFGLNQFIVQRALAPKTLKQGQMGVMFAATLWLITLALIVAMPLKDPRTMPVRKDLDMRTSPVVMAYGIRIMVAVVAFFVVFR